MILPEILQAEATRTVKSRAERGWDLWPEFVLYTGEDADLKPHLLAVIDGRIHPEHIPKVMAQTVLKFRAESPDVVITAAALTFEGYGVTQPPEDASAEVRERFEQDRVNRQFWAREDRREMVMTMVCDCDTLAVASSQIVRDENEGHPEEHLAWPDDEDAHMGGRLFSGVRRAAALAVLSDEELLEMIMLIASGQSPN